MTETVRLKGDEVFEEVCAISSRSVTPQDHCCIRLSRGGRRQSGAMLPKTPYVTPFSSRFRLWSCIGSAQHFVNFRKLLGNRLARNLFPGQLLIPDGDFCWSICYSRATHKACRRKSDVCASASENTLVRRTDCKSSCNALKTLLLVACVAAWCLAIGADRRKAQSHCCRLLRLSEATSFQGGRLPA